jgi:hypothetical protein
VANEIVRGYQFDLEKNRRPTAAVYPPELEAVVGSVVRLDGRASTDPESSDLIFKWAFVTVPIGSQVSNDGFFNLESDGSIVSFAPDVTGHYQVSLIVNDGSMDSEAVYAEIDVRLIMIPNHKGLVPDAGFIWRYLSDFWTRVEGRRRFEIFWSAAIQLVAAEQLKLYQYDYNKSIHDIQKLMQRRWLSYEPKLDLSGIGLSFILADDQAGAHATTTLVDPTTGAVAEVQPDYSNLVSIPAGEGSFSDTNYGSVCSGRVLTVGGRSYISGRSCPLYRAELSDSDGDTVLSGGELPFTFHGSGFVPSHVGMSLKISSGSRIGTSYVINEVLNSASVVLQATGTWASETDITYSVLPATPDSAFFANRDGVVPTKQISQYWRFSATMIANTDLEALGVAPGDVIEVEVRRTDDNKFGTLQVQVVSIDRTRVGFVFNLEDLVPGVAAGGLSNEAQIALAEALRVPTVVVSSAGDVYCSDQAAVVSSNLRSVRFRRLYFEKVLTSDTVIDLGPFSVTLTPKAVIRNKLLPLAVEVVSVPLLQEYLSQPDLFEKDGVTYQQTDKGTLALDHAPYLLVENLDYLIDDASSISGVCDVRHNDDLVRIKYGDLVDRNVQPGDKIDLALGADVPTFDILQVVDAETLRISSSPNTTSIGTNYRIQRKVGGRFLRFVNQTFGPKKLAPERLWAEISYYDNSEAIEGNFGILVGLTREQFKAQQGTASYHSAVAGLMYALANGPTETNLELAGQILLGLPFAENAGVITEIDQVYRRTIFGEPLYSRMLIEARDTEDKPIGLTNIYFIPLGRQVEVETGVYIPTSPDFSGVAINPSTRVTYQVGDRVTQFAKLSKGVLVENYLSKPDWFRQLIDQGSFSMLEKYHSFRFTANVDVVSTGDIDMCAQYFRTKAKPSHVRLIPALLQVIPEYVKLTDEIIFGFGQPPVFFDTPAFSLPMAVKFDKDLGGDVFFTFGGKLLNRYISGLDLVTTKGSADVYSKAAGFIDARAAFGEAHDTPFVRAGDILQISESSNSGRYVITNVFRDGDNKDTMLTIDLAGRVLESQIDQVFNVYRPIENPLWETTIDITNGSADATVVEGGSSAGIGVGDTVVFCDPANLTWFSHQYRVGSYNPLTYALKLVPSPTEATGSYKAMFVREGLLLRNIFEDTGYQLVMYMTAGNPWVTISWSSPGLMQFGLIKPGDRLVMPGDYTFEVLQVQPETLKLYVTPTPDVSWGGMEVRVVRPSRPVTMASADILDRFPEDRLNLALVSVDADLLTVATSDVVTTVSGTVFNDPEHTPWVSPDPWPDPTLNTPPDPAGYYDTWPVRGHISNANISVLPGDELEILSGPDAGIHTVVEVPTSTSLRLMVALSADSAPGGVAYKIRRKRPNEG